MRIGIGLALSERASGGSVISTPRDQKLLGISTRLHLPVSTQTASAGREVLYSSVHIGFPSWAGVTNWMAAFPWFWGDEDPQGDPPEKDIDNGGSVYASLGISGVFTMGAFDGQQEGVMSANSWGRWCDLGNPTYTNRGTGKIRSACVCATGALRPVGFSRQSNNNEAAEWSNTLNLAKIQTGGTITHNSSIAYMYGPCLMIGKGNDGRMVPGIFGNSLDFSNDENASLSDSRGNMGFWQRGFDENVVGDALPYINFAIAGSRFGQQLSLDLGAFKRRAEILHSVSTGMPFDVGVGGDENSAQSDSVAWRQVIDDFADFINDTFGMPFAHRTMFPKVSYINNHRGDTVADQTAAVDARIATSDDLVANPADYPTFEIGEEFRDSGVPSKWKTGGFTTTVAANYGGSGAISLNDSPPTGTVLVFNAGDSDVAVRTVTAVSGSGPYNVTCSTAPPVQSQNDPVGSSQTDGDGTHYTTAGARDLAAPIVAAGKLNFV